MRSTRAYFIEQVVINIIINFLLAYYGGRATMAKLDSIPLWAPETAPFDPNMGGEILVGSFLLGLILTAVLTAITRHKLRKETIDVSSYAVTGLVARLPAGLLKRSLVVGLVTMLSAGLAVVLVMLALGINQADAWSYHLAHSVYMATLGGVVAYFAVRRALAD